MDGYFAKLAQICDLADKYNTPWSWSTTPAPSASSAPTAAQNPEHCDVEGRIDIITGTLGKALGGASGGYTSGRKEIIQLLRQRSRPYLFSNSLAPPIVAASLAILDLLTTSNDLRETLRANTAFFRQQMTALGFDILPGEHPIVPVMFGDAL